MEGIDYIGLKKIVEIYYEMYPENIGLKTWFFLDEIQNAPEWERVVRSIMDRYTDIFVEIFFKTNVQRDCYTA